MMQHSEIEYSIEALIRKWKSADASRHQNHACLGFVRKSLSRSPDLPVEDARFDQCNGQKSEVSKGIQNQSGGKEWL